MKINPEQRPETSCDCKECRDMCRRSPCFPTPAEAVELIRKGYGSKLMLSEWHSGIPGEAPYFVLSGQHTPTGCTFLTPEGLCSLHDVGLKPMEGRLAIHWLADDGLRHFIAKKWCTAVGIFIIKQFMDSILSKSSPSTL